MIYGHFKEREKNVKAINISASCGGIMISTSPKKQFFTVLIRYMIKIIN